MSLDQRTPKGYRKAWNGGKAPELTATEEMLCREIDQLKSQLTAAEQGATALRETLGQEARTFFDKYVRISDRLEQTEHMLAAVVEAFAPIIDSTKGDGKSNWKSVLNVLDYKDVGKVGAWTLEQLNALELPARQAWEVAREALSSSPVPPSQKAGER